MCLDVKLCSDYNLTNIMILFYPFQMKVNVYLSKSQRMTLVGLLKQTVKKSDPVCDLPGSIQIATLKKFSRSVSKSPGLTQITCCFQACEGFLCLNTQVNDEIMKTFCSVFATTTKLCEFNGKIKNSPTIEILLMSSQLRLIDDGNNFFSLINHSTHFEVVRLEKDTADIELPNHLRMTYASLDKRADDRSSAQEHAAASFVDLKNRLQNMSIEVTPGKSVDVDADQGKVAEGLVASTPVKDGGQSQQQEESASEVNSTIVNSEADGFTSLYSRGEAIMDEIGGSSGEPSVQVETPLLQLAEKIKDLINNSMDSAKDLQRFTVDLPIFDMVRRANCQDRFKLRFRPKLTESDLAQYEEKLDRILVQLGI